MIRKNNLNNITSKYVLNTIFNYIADYKFKFKLFKHSKSFQKKLDLELYKYQYEFLKKSGIDLVNYFSLFDNYDLNSFSYKSDYNKEKIKGIIEEDLKNNFDTKIIQNFINGHYKDYSENNFKIIDFNSKLFNCISQSKHFDKIFLIPITILKEEDKKKYLPIFETLNTNANNNDLTYSLLFEYINEKDIDYFNELKINFNKINNLIIRPNFLGMIKTYQNYNYLIKTLFDFNNDGTKLNFLSLNLSDFKIESLDDFEKINNIKSLKHLQLENIIFKKTFYLKLKDLSSLSIMNCRNISFSADEKFDKLQKLDISDTLFTPPDNQKTLIAFPSLEELVLDNFGSVFEKYRLIIDFDKLKRIKKISANIADFIKLDFECLEKATIVSSRKELTLESSEKALEKIISLKSLIEVDFPLLDLDEETKSNINDKNISIKKVIIRWFNENKECQLNNLQELFPNLTSLNIYFPFASGNYSYDLVINQNSNCNINNFIINGFGKLNTEFDVKSFENLTKIDIQSNISVPKFINTIKNCNFKSLIYFGFNVTHEKLLSSETLKDICSSVDNMPKLEDFKLLLQYGAKNQDEYFKFFEDFVKKLLEKKLNSLELIIKIKDEPMYNTYSIQELKEKYPKINCNSLYGIKIIKYDTN